MDPASSVVPDWVKGAIETAGLVYQRIGASGVVTLTACSIALVWAWRLNPAHLRDGFARIWGDVYPIWRDNRLAKRRVLERQEEILGLSARAVDRRSSPVALVVDAELEPPDRDDPRVSGKGRRYPHPDD